MPIARCRGFPGPDNERPSPTHSPRPQRAAPCLGRDDLVAPEISSGFRLLHRALRDGARLRAPLTRQQDRQPERGRHAGVRDDPTRAGPSTDRATGLSASRLFRAAWVIAPGLGEKRRRPIFQGSRSARGASSIARPARRPKGAHDGPQTTAVPLLTPVPSGSIASPIPVNLSTAQDAIRAGPARRRTSRALTSGRSRASNGRRERR
jgi:hypothetical protein